jgi:16S rRNA (guanine(966)-N(2))-methyltransferase RsmD
MTRIVAGRYGGRLLATPPGRDTRPTLDRVREALFSTLETMTPVDGARFADLYAGSGAVGLEAASRGAVRVLLVESDPRTARIARQNVAALQAAPVEVVTARVEKALQTAPPEPYDIVFADPPYALPDAALAAVLGALVEGGWLAEEAVVVVERSVRGAPVAGVRGLTAERSRRYGETVLWYGRRS